MKVLLTLDGSDFAEAAIPIARQLAAMPGAEIHLLAVIEPDAVVERPRAVAAASHANGVAWLSADECDPDPAEALPLGIDMILEHYLEEVARQFPENVVRPALRVGPYPAEQIIAYAEANGIDLIVMATHGRKGIDQLVHGSIAGRVLRAGVAPVALVRPDRAA